MSDAINAGATLSAFTSGLGAATAGARILYALARDAPLANMLGRTSTRTGAPAGALTVTLIVGVGAIVFQRIAGASTVNAFFYPGPLGVLSLLVADLVTNVGAINFLFVKARRAPLWEIVFPVLGIVFLGYTLDKNVFGVALPYSRFPLVVGIWLAIGLLIVLLTPRLASTIGASLARDEGSSRWASCPIRPTIRRKPGAQGLSGQGRPAGGRRRPGVRTGPVLGARDPLRDRRPAGLSLAQRRGL